MKISTILTMLCIIPAQTMQCFHDNRKSVASSLAVPREQTVIPLVLEEIVNPQITMIFNVSITSENRLGYSAQKRESRGIKRERSKPIARFAFCIPTPTIIHLVTDARHGHFVFQPSCVRVNRCSGCCHDRNFACMPTNITSRKMNVHFINNLSDEVEKQEISIEEHASCRCNCALQPQNCHSKAQLENCRCICQNFDENTRCVNESRIKMWDSDNCSCHCREVEPCSEGLAFNHERCKCEFTEEYLRRRALQRRN